MEYISDIALKALLTSMAIGGVFVFIGMVVVEIADRFDIVEKRCKRMKRKGIRVSSLISLLKVIVNIIVIMILFAGTVFGCFMAMETFINGLIEMWK